jgi:hypothetical protein
MYGADLVFKATLYLPLGFILFFNLCSQIYVKYHLKYVQMFMHTANSAWTKTTELDLFYEQFVEEACNDVMATDFLVQSILFALLWTRSCAYFIYLDKKVSLWQG